MGWWDKAKENVGKVVGKAKEVGKLYDKAKEMYNKGKETISKIPVVGAAASRVIAEKEGQFGKKFQEVTGMSPGQFDAKQKQVREMIDKIPM